jgi:uncharacterized protein YrzB (UPF0473 family)
VTHKEKLRERTRQVDTLTLSATPIPRTLNMALSGIRDMSTIEEPPRDRQPVQTYVLEHDWTLLADAMRRELARGGQIYYLHNRVENIESTAGRLQQLLGEDVSIGAFSFRALPGKELKLYRIMLFLDEDVDMEKMQEKITKTYNNEGTGEYYVSYTPISDTEWDSETGEVTHSNWRLNESKKGGDPTLNFLARNPFNSNDEWAQMMNEAVKKVVEDPDFKRYNWISSVNAAEIMPAEDVEWLRAWHEESDVPWEITQEWMEKAPLVAISMSNRTRQAIQKELEGTKTGELSYATHNQIIFDADVLIYFEDYVDKLALDSGE